MTIQDLQNSSYLGDGVYIGYMYNALWIITTDGITITNQICLEDEVLSALNKYLQMQRNNND
jgi:hypothetical protein